MGRCTSRNFSILIDTTSLQKFQLDKTCSSSLSCQIFFIVTWLLESDMSRPLQYRPISLRDRMRKGFQDLSLAASVMTHRWTRNTPCTPFPGLRLSQRRACIILLLFCVLILSHKHDLVCTKSFLKMVPHNYSIGT